MSHRIEIENTAAEIDAALLNLALLCNKFSDLCALEDKAYRAYRKGYSSGNNHDAVHPHPLFEFPDKILRQAFATVPEFRKMFSLRKPVMQSLYLIVKEFPNSFRKRDI